jgi:hypothetical protein
MKRAIRERPRVAAAAVLGVVALVLVGVALGALIPAGPSAATTTTQLRLASAESTARDAARRLRVAEADASNAEEALQRSQRLARNLARKNAELLRGLRKARQAAHRQSRRQGSRSSSDR